MRSNFADGSSSGGLRGVPALLLLFRRRTDEQLAELLALGLLFGTCRLTQPGLLVSYLFADAIECLQYQLYFAAVEDFLLAYELGLAILLRAIG